MEGIIRVTPEQLNQTASEFENKASSISSLTSEMTSQVTGMASAWEGEAAASYVSKFQGLEDDIQRMIRMVQEHAADLQEMARNYSSAETTNMESISGLSSDVII